MTIDTACSGSLVSLDVACRYLQTGEVNGAIVAGANIYLSPEHVMDSKLACPKHTLPISDVNRNRWRDERSSISVRQVSHI